MSHVTLIRPAMVVVRLIQSRSTCPPIGVVYLAASLKKAGHQVHLIDAVGESILQILPFDGGDEYGHYNFFHGLTLDETVDRVDPNTDYIGVSCMFSIEWPLVRELLVKLRKRFPDKPIIIGGEHVTAMAEWRPEVDYAILGEGEGPLVALIAALESGQPAGSVPGVVAKQNPKKPQRTGSVDRYLFDLRIREVDDIPLPDWDSIPILQYLDNGFGYGTDRGRNMPMLATRGCPYQCTFCSSPQMWSTKWLARKPELVLDEMELYQKKYGAENFSFYSVSLS
ncbi:MAG: cobalamin B12-binding domain-containing protein [Deltaproteobacteria bacterium]|nr:cobalamin B12-binding domain-containing protein [Deltaproteobacteria bacterium]